MGNDGGTWRTAARAAVIAGVLVSSAVVLDRAPAAADPGDPTCPAPTATLSATWHEPRDPGVNPPGSQGYATSYWTAHGDVTQEAASLDMDGDGTPDTVSRVGDDVVVQRGDGTLTLALEMADAPFFSTRFDDLDDDGRAELVVYQGGSDALGIFTIAWIVPGTTPVGTGDLPDAAIRVTGRIIPDVTGDGRDDLTQLNMVGGPEIAMSGAEVLGETTVGSGPATTVQRIGVAGDLDFDGFDDRLILGPADGSEDPHIQLTTGPSLVLGTATPDAGGMVRHGTRFYARLVFDPTPGNIDRDVTAYRVRIGCAEAWLRNATVLLGNHFPGPDDRDDFGTETDPWQSSRTTTALRLIRSAGGRMGLIDRHYEQFLDRSTDAAGRKYWFAAFMDRGATEERLAAELLGSNERFRKSGSTIEGWVHTAFQKAFGRPADGGGFSYWKRQAQSLGLVRTAARMLASREARQEVLQRLSEDPLVIGGPLDGVQYTLGINAWDRGGYDAMLAELVGGDRAYLHAQATNRLSPF